MVPEELDLAWQAFLRRFAAEHTFRMLEQTPGLPLQSPLLAIIIRRAIARINDRNRAGSPSSTAPWALTPALLTSISTSMPWSGLSSDVVREILPCARAEHPRGDCGELLTRVRQVRDELMQQEQRIAERRRRLDTYLANGYEAHPAG